MPAGAAVSAPPSTMYRSSWPHHPRSHRALLSGSFLALTPGPGPPHLCRRMHVADDAGAFRGFALAPDMEESLDLKFYTSGPGARKVCAPGSPPCPSVSHPAPFQPQDQPRLARPSTGANATAPQNSSPAIVVEPQGAAVARSVSGGPWRFLHSSPVRAPGHSPSAPGSPGPTAHRFRTKWRMWVWTRE